VEGRTTHQLLKLPIDSSDSRGEYNALNPDDCRNLRSELRDGLLYILDEVSMVGVTLSHRHFILFVR